MVEAGQGAERVGYQLVALATAVRRELRIHPMLGLFHRRGFKMSRAEHPTHWTMKHATIGV